MSVYPVNDVSLSAEQHAFPLVIVYSTRSATIAPHHHPFYEISLYTGGSAAEIVSGVRVPAARGTLVRKPPHHIHHTVPAPGEEYAKYSVMFDIDALLDSKYERNLRHFYELADDRGQWFFLQYSENVTARLEPLLRELFALSRARPRPPYAESLQKAKLTEFLALAAASAEAEAPGSGAAGQAGPKGGVRPKAGPAAEAGPNPAGAASPNRGGLGKAAVEHIHRRFLEDLSLASLADRFNVSAPYMSAVIKRTTGLTFVDYVQSLRIEHAGSLLRSGAMSVMDVAAESGFNSYKTFVRAFRKWKGEAPAEYRRRWQEEQEMRRT